MKPVHTYNIELRGDRYVGKTTLFKTLSGSRPPPVFNNQMIIPLSVNSPYRIHVNYQMWDNLDMKSELSKAGICPPKDIILALIDPSRPETLSNLAEVIIPVEYLAGAKIIAVIVNHIPNRVEKMTLLHVRDYIKARCNLPFPVYVFEGSVDNYIEMAKMIKTLMIIRKGMHE